MISQSYVCLSTKIQNVEFLSNATTFILLGLLVLKLKFLSKEYCYYRWIVGGNLTATWKYHVSVIMINAAFTMQREYVLNFNKYFLNTCIITCLVVHHPRERFICIPLEVFLNHFMLYLFIKIMSLCVKL